MRDEFTHYKNLGKQKSGSDVYFQNHKHKCHENVRQNPLDYCRTESLQWSDSDKFRVDCFLSVIDQIVSSLHERIATYEEVESIFGFLRKLNSLTLLWYNIVKSVVKTISLKVIKIYKDDLEDNLIPELI